MRALGLMSGTSMDGIDVALVDTDGEGEVATGPHAIYPYDNADRDLLRAALAAATAMRYRDERSRVLRDAEALVTTRHAAAIEAFLAAHDLPASAVAIVGFHGQTVLHRPDNRLTVQIGDGAALAIRLGIPVAWDFRAADVAAGGQGAPLVPVYHQALLDGARSESAAVLVNIGGVANISAIAPGRDPIACDTGPGNALLDDLMAARTGQSYDAGGAMALAGRVDDFALARLLAHPFFAAPPPKSLDRNAFSLAAVDGLATADAAATLAAFTAAAVARAVADLPEVPRRAILCGGGRHNGRIVAELTARLPCPVVTADSLGWAGDAIEAQAFAYLAVRHTRGLPLTFPGTTGVGAPTLGGRMSRPV